MNLSRSLLKRKNFWVILICDLILLSLCYYGAYWLRFDRGGFNPLIRAQIIQTIIPIVAMQIACFFFFDVYRGMWRYVGIKDLLNLLKGTITSAVLFVGYLALFYHFSGVSRGVIFIDAILTIILIGGFRLAIRMFYQKQGDFSEELMFWRRSHRVFKKVFIIGTGPLAEKLFREIDEFRKLKYRVIGFVDGNQNYKGMKIHGVPILGSIRELPQLISFYEIEEILIVGSDLKAEEISKIVEMCGDCGVRFKVIPELSDRLNRGISDNLRDINLEDLMDREPVQLDMRIVRSEIEGQSVLVTGAGGSIGSELCRQILSYHPAKLVLVDNAETPLYQIDLELNSLKTSKSRTLIIPCIGDVRSRRSLERIFRLHRPQLVYHAAAYKHVPMMELSPLDAINNNVIGTFKLATIACKFDVRKFVMISTDKAVRPTSIMGATKRAAELVVQAMSGNGISFIVVRFGNVLGSNGSVVPLFQRQIMSGGPVTVTHPEITRYFMTIPEAVMLVLQAGAFGKGGELFLLDMGKPVKIDDLARNMIRLAGLVPGRDVMIEYVGLRPGEKLYEELLIEGEGIIDTCNEKIKVCNTFSRIDDNSLFEAIEHFQLLLKTSGDNDAALKVLERLVPDFRRETVEESPILRSDIAGNIQESKTTSRGLLKFKRSSS
jgi:FlaA1/EpsC-like NDP-sugar epimerase